MIIILELQIYMLIFYCKNWYEEIKMFYMIYDSQEPEYEAEFTGGVTQDINP